ncbi:hypothetical protein MLD38_010250 [Melastoma candidum]|uniref:Uncharacterized protein n=1 Tax=Melastoma candidum TaxID=119954 RepID=A0ACB9R2C5_9MYRT|nr:hypothetical protein MLD38_010250 [Melastoma candidum]
MAKYGEGDNRWIVEERPDGTNVHNWHWAETDCLDYSRSLLTSLLSNLPLLSSPSLSLTSTSVDSVEGEAYVNIRKGKIIPGYELSLSISWKGSALAPDGSEIVSVDGTVDIPYLADENADEDPEVRITVKDEGEVGKRCRDAMAKEGKKMILEKVRVYVESMAKGGPVKDEVLAKKKAGGGSVAAPAVAAEASGKSGASGDVKKEEKAKKVEQKGGLEGRKTIKLSEKFSCRARDLWEIMMDESRWKGFTQSNARISREVGGEIMVFDGSVTGSNVELQEGKLIVQKWRFGSWPDGFVSTVKLVFEEPEPGVTVVRLTHSDIPEEDRYGNATVAENTERGWRDLIFHRIRAVFGFGI